MKIEKKQISDTEILLFFNTAFPIVGTFYVTNDIPSISVLENIMAQKTAEKLLLTADFIYLKTNSPKNIDDLLLITLAELDDYAESLPKMEFADVNNTEEKIKIILKTIIAPFLQADGGDIELLSYHENTVEVHFLGKCQGCPYAERTLKERVAKNLIRYLPHIKEVVLK